MSKQPKIAMIVGNYVNNGITKVVFNYSKKLVEKGCSVDVFSGGTNDVEKIKEAESEGIKVIALPHKKHSPRAYYRALKSALGKDRYEIAYIHGNSALILPDLVIAKQSGSTKVAAHCHNVKCSNTIAHFMLKRLIPYFANVRLSCSNAAGAWLFGKSSFTVLPNAFQVEKFRFDESSRCLVRKKLGIDESTTLYGHVGRFNPQKNHAFLIQVFERIKALRSDSALLLVGDGPDRLLVEEAVKESCCSDSIIIYGDEPEPAKLYSAMDAFLFPSLFEGLGIVLLEAQISGLKCYSSKVIADDVILSKDFQVLPLELGANKWGELIAANCEDREERFKRSYECDASSFEIEASCKLLFELFEIK